MKEPCEAERIVCEKYRYAHLSWSADVFYVTYANSMVSRVWHEIGQGKTVHEAWVNAAINCSKEMTCPKTK